MALASRAVDTDKRFPGRNSDPADSAVAVSKSDTNDIDGNTFNRMTSRACRSLYVGGTGDLKVTMADGSVVTFTAVPVGIFPIRVKQLWSAVTSATNVVALF